MPADRWTRGLCAAAVWLAALVGCAQPVPDTAPPAPTPPPVRVEAYPWLADLADEPPLLVTTQYRFPSPAGFERLPVEAGSFGEWLRGLPLRTDRRTVLSYRGRPLGVAAAVAMLDVGDGDLQQCADTLVRLHAEYLWASGRAAQARYHFTSGDAVTWADWVAGEVIEVRGSEVRRRRGHGRPDGHSSYRDWLQQVFAYAGTLSLRLDSVPVPPDEALAPGDFFVEPGSPGHAVMLLDVARDPDGRGVALVAQGYTPAQELHVLEGRGPEVLDSAWFPLPEGAGDSLEVPSWRPFPRESARRFTIPRASVASGQQ